MIKIFSKIPNTRPSIDFFKEELKRYGDVSTVIGNAYVNEGGASSSSILLAKIDDMLFELSEESKEKEKLEIVKKYSGQALFL